MSLSGRDIGPVTVAAALLVLSGALVGRLRLQYLVGRTAIILPFAVPAVALTAWSASAGEAGALLLRAALSAASVVVVAGTTYTPEIAAGLQRLGLPALVADTVLLTLRYLESIAAEAASIRRAALARGGGWSWTASGSGVGVLFASSFRRSEAVHRAMLARGYSGTSLAYTVAPTQSQRNDVVLMLTVAIALGTGWAWLLWHR